MQAYFWSVDVYGVCSVSSNKQKV